MATAKKLSKEERSEICQSYRLAKNKEEQVNILAELYATNTAQIRGVLYDGGVYDIGPEQLLEAAEKIRTGVTFGGLRNYKKTFAGIDAKTAKKIFKDYTYMPWGAECEEEAAAIREQIEGALNAAKDRAEPKKKPALINPPLTDPAREFTPAEVRILVNGLLSIQAQDFALETQLRHEIEKMHRDAAEILAEAEQRMSDLKEVEARIAQSKGLLQRLADLNTEEQAAAATT